MTVQKALPDLTDFLGGLNTSSNPLTKKPNEWSACQNVFVGKAYGFKTGTVEENHVAQTRPPMRLFFNAPFDVAVAGSPTEVKPLVGATTAPADNQPTQWQSIAKCTLAEGFVATGGNGGTPDTVAQTTGLTQSDGNNIALALSSNGSAGALTHMLSTTLTDGLTKGLVGNNTTLVYIDYSELYNTTVFTGGSNSLSLASLELRIGTDSTHYLSFTLPVTSPITGATAYFTNRYSVALRSYNSKTGAFTFGQIVSNIKYIAVIGTQNGIVTGGGAQTVLFTIDHVRLDVDYLGFFGDFTVGQPYQQVTIDSLDFTTSLVKGTWTLDAPFYYERRLSIGNGCLAFESDASGTFVAHTTLNTPFDITKTGFPLGVLLDYRVENLMTIASGNAITIRIGSDSSNFYNFSFPSTISGSSESVLSITNLTLQSINGTPVNTSIKYVAIVITINAVPGGGTTCKAYLNNLRFAPYTVGTGFAVQSGNIRDTFLYDPTDIGQSSRFITSCGDTLFVGNSLLSANSWYIEGGFTNWTQANPNLPERFVFAMVTNPNFIATQTLGADAAQATSSLTLTSFPTNLQIGEQVVIDPNGVYPELNYVASTYVVGSVTVPLTTPLAQPHSSGATVTWENTAQPKNQVLLVNGVDGLYSVDIFTYPVSAGVTYQYPRFTKLAPEAYSSVIVHKGYASLAGDPNNPNRVVWAPISGLPNIPAESFFELDTQGKITAGDKITAQWSFEKYHLAIRKTDVAITYGDSINNITTDWTSANRGALGQNHVAQAGRRLFFFAYDGVYEFAGLTTQKISDNVNNYFQTNDLTLMQSGFIFYNPIREILCCVLPISTSYLLDPLTTATQYCLTFSLQQNAWGNIFGTVPGIGSPYDPRNTPFSAVFYGGGASAPAVFFSSTTMVEWDNGPDTHADIISLRMAPNGFGNFFQEKVFDKFYIWAKNLSIASGYSITPNLNLVLGYNAFNKVALAGVGQVGADLDGMLELFCPSGTWGKAAGPEIITGYTAWATPVQFEMFGLSHWATQEL